MKSVKFLALLLGWQSVSNLSELRADIPFKEITPEGHKSYVLSQNPPADFRDELKLFFTNELEYGKRITGTWTPTQEDVTAAETAAWKLVQQSTSNPVLAFPYLAHCKPEDKDKMWKNAENEARLVYEHRGKYDAQYIGIVLDGKKQIFGNYFILFPGFHIDPTIRLVDVNDGGWNYWQVLYDVKSKTSANLQINGPWELDW